MVSFVTKTLSYYISELLQIEHKHFENRSKQKKKKKKKKKKRIVHLEKGRHENKI